MSKRYNCKVCNPQKHNSTVLIGSFNSRFSLPIILSTRFRRWLSCSCRFISNKLGSPQLMFGICFVDMQSSALHLLQMPNYGNLVLNSTLLHPVSSIERCRLAFSAWIGLLFYKPKSLNSLTCFIIVILTREAINLHRFETTLNVFPFFPGLQMIVTTGSPY